jgi:hypothetical protein
LGNTLTLTVKPNLVTGGKSLWLCIQIHIYIVTEEMKRLYLFSMKELNCGFDNKKKEETPF